jgi:protein-tyrosine phosphatase
VVHGSAGCGRTGTFCAVDSVIDMLKRQRAAAGPSDAGHDAQGDVVMAGASAIVTSPLSGGFVASPVAAAPVSGSFFASPLSATARRASNSSVGSAVACGRPAEQSAPLDVSWLDDASLDLIQQTVEDFRRQRISMVQSLRQFVLCYETVTEWAWRARERAGGGLVRAATMDVAGGGGGVRTARRRSGQFGGR